MYAPFHLKYNGNMYYKVAIFVFYYVKLELYA